MRPVTSLPAFQAGPFNHLGIAPCINKNNKYILYLQENKRSSFHYFYILFFQVLGLNNISIGNNSNLPAIISKDRIILEKGENPANDPIGPFI